ncbi:creatininase family protein [Actinokineospora globicatena]|uniref:Creatinine amidohydrolase n=1 Tax=Actinokineospora globicatena TaxID=103729 RepID=A0A9W6QMD0_9PSEU|nr:creatininase family protein [Actinokineospora globicatena]GLW93556.1 creatinine amidohydrolase [Actinokineospora globicatena]
MSHQFADLTSPQAAALRETTTVLLLPVGAVEPHGPHAPLDTDPIISAGMCARAADLFADDPAITVKILPALSYGVTEFGSAFAGAVGISAETLHALVVEICSSLAAQGFLRVVIVNNHFEPGHVSALRTAVKTLADRGIQTSYLDLLRRAAVARLTEEFQSGSCHAGRYETSLVLADHPHLVDTEAMASLPPVRVDMPAAMGAGAHGFHEMGMTDAYCGAPAEASAAEGHDTFARLTDLLVEAIRAACHDHVR